MKNLLFLFLLFSFGLTSLSAQNGHFIDTGEALRIESTNTSAWMSLYHGTNYKGYLWATGNTIQVGSSDGDVRLASSGGVVATFDEAKNVGIGTASPVYKTDIVGNRVRLRDGTGGTAKTIMLRSDGAAVDLQAENADLFIRAVGNDININPFIADGNVWINGQTLASGGTAEEFNVIGSDMILEDDSPYIRLVETEEGGDLFDQAGINFRDGTANRYWMNYDFSENKFYLGDNFNLASSDFTIDGTTGDIDIANNISAGGDVDVSGALLFGSVESLSDGGGFTIESNSSLRPDIDLVRDLGTSTLAWDWVYYDDLSNQSFAPGNNEEVKSISNSLDRIMNVQAVSFKSRNDELQRVKTGFDPEELIKVIPEAVTTMQKQFDQDGNATYVEAKRKGVNYDALIPVLIQGMQEQQNIIETLEARIKQLENE